MEEKKLAPIEELAKKNPVLEEIRSNVFIEKEAPKHTSGITDIDAFIGLGIDNEWSLKQLINNLEINIHEINEERNYMVFDMIGIDTSIANAFRRILLAEVPTMAIEDCCVLQNNSILQDEVLCHRLGLIPIAVDPRLFDEITEEKSRYLNGQEPCNTLIFKLNIECKTNPKSTEKDPPHKRYINSIVTSGDIEWVPQVGQMELLKKHNHPTPIKMVYDDIIIAKLRPGQCIEVSMRAIKGIGRDHAKFSPVGTATYKLLPSIDIEYNDDDNEIKLDDAKYLKDLCPKNVFDVEDIGNNYGHINVARPRNCSLCRECIMDERIKQNIGKIKLKKKRNHFIFKIENIGQYPNVTDLFIEALNILKQKCNKLIDGIIMMKNKENEMLINDEDDDDNDGDDDMQDID